jgi:DMSO/TMAO reductase YedYZ molybdopterin-dependent catalytic subunit
MKLELFSGISLKRIRTGLLKARYIMKTKRFISLFLAGVIMVSAAGCLDSGRNGQQTGSDAVSNATKARYRENEITEYEGARLDPAIGPRDNSISGVQYIDISDYNLEIDGLVVEKKTLRYKDVLELDAHTRKITLYCVEGWNSTILWEGVLLEELIAIAGAKPEANNVIFHASDGYTTSLPLDIIKSKQLMLAYKSNGLELPPELGYPFIVIAEDKLGYKWARWVTRIELSDDLSYKGYWESNGYSNSADIS